jgi:putative DNA primase/helicase
MPENTKSRARGRWRSILPALGVSASLIDGKHHPCPHCGGKDRFRFVDYNGSGGYICSGCGNGSGFDLLMKLKGWDFKTTAQEVDKIVGSCAPNANRAERSESSKRNAMNRLWRSGALLTPEDPAGRYLWHRCRVTTFPSCLRFVPAMHCGGVAVAYPGLLAKLTAPDGTPSNIHRTYLTELGRKAPVESPRRMMPGSVAKGGAVRLAAPEATLGIAEGIETALSASALTGIPCWAALNAEMLKVWQPPEVVTRVVIFADHDESFAGQTAAYALAHGLNNKGYQATVRIPAQAGHDWNDVHQQSLEGGMQHGTDPLRQLR